MNAIAKINHQTESLDPAVTESLLLRGDTSKLTPTQKMQYAVYRCRELGLDPAMKPFEYMTLNGKEVLYLNKGGADALCQARGTSREIVSTVKIDDVLVITVKATDRDGRFDVSTGAVCLKGLSGQNLANAMLKCESKAKRRAAISLHGLGVMDESEVDDVRGTHKSAANSNAFYMPDKRPPLVAKSQLQQIAEQSTAAHLASIPLDLDDDNIPEFEPKKPSVTKLPEKIPDLTYDEFIFTPSFSELIKLPELAGQQLGDLTMNQLISFAEYFGKIKDGAQDAHNKQWFKYLYEITTDALSDKYQSKPSA